MTSGEPEGLYGKGEVLVPATWRTAAIGALPGQAGGRAARVLL